MSDISAMAGRPLEVINGGDFSEDVCEHCLGGVFKDSGSIGECRIGPPTPSMLVVPTQVQPTPSNPNGVQMTAQQYSAFPKVERRMFCMAFEPKEGEVEH